MKQKIKKKQIGQISLKPIWENSKIENIALNLPKGNHVLKLSGTENVDIAAIALTNCDVQIPWGIDILPQEPKIKTLVKFEGIQDSSVLRPRIRLQNISDKIINGFSVRYYFKGENPLNVKADAYYPYDNSEPTVHSESKNTGYVEWKFPNTQIPIKDFPFYGEGPHFGIYNKDYSPWNYTDDPSFVENSSQQFIENMGIIVLDNQKNLIGGNCVEIEDSVEQVTKLQVFAADMRNDNQSSEIHIKVQNIGNSIIKNYKVHYYFYSPIEPNLDVYYLPLNINTELKNLGNNRYVVVLNVLNNLLPNAIWEESAKFSIHLKDWSKNWNVFDDPSHKNLNGVLNLTENICVYDDTNKLIYGHEPNWNNQYELVYMNLFENYIHDFLATNYTAP